MKFPVMVQISVSETSKIKNERDAVIVLGNVFLQIMNKFTPLLDEIVIDPTQEEKDKFRLTDIEMSYIIYLIDHPKNPNPEYNKIQSIKGKFAQMKRTFPKRL